MTIGGPGAAIASSATLGNIGEGSTKGKTLFKNNEDYTALRAAYTTNGFTFTDLGIISGTDPASAPSMRPKKTPPFISIVPRNATHPRSGM